MPYRGECQVHRAEIFQLHGSWAEATEEAVQVSERVPDRGATLRAARITGLPSSIDYAVSSTWPSASYVVASACGREVQPGLALPVAQGNPDHSDRWLDRALAESRDPARQSLLLAAKVEITLAAGIIDGTPAALTQLEDNAAAIQTPLPRQRLPPMQGTFGLPRVIRRPPCRYFGRHGHCGSRSTRRTRPRSTRVVASAACREPGDDDAASDGARCRSDDLRAAGRPTRSAAALAPSRRGCPWATR